MSSAALRKTLTGWLKNVGFIKTYTDNDGKSHMDITSVSDSIGIFAENRTSANGTEYKCIMYKPKAQQFIIDNLDPIMEYAVENLSE